MRNIIWNIAAVLLASTPAAWAQSNQPTFNSSVDVVNVTLDVVPTRNGQFVRDLTKNDFQVFEDGREQRITTFERIDLSPTITTPPHRPDGSAPPEDRAPANGRLYVLLLDDLHTPEPRTSDVRSQARKFVEQSLLPGDSALVLVTSGRNAKPARFTADRRTLLEAISHFSGQATLRDAVCGANTNTNSDVCATADDRTTLQVIAAVSKWLEPISGTRKGILLFGEGLSFDRADYFLHVDQPDSAPSDVASDAPKLSSGGLRLNQRINSGVAAYGATLPDLLAAETAEARANVVLYPMDPRRHPEALFSKVVQDMSSYYLLGYQPTNTKRDGSFRRIDVKPNKPGIHIDARAGYTAPSDEHSNGDGVSAQLARLLAEPLPVSGLPFAVTAASFAGESGRNAVEVVVDLDARDVLALPSSSGILSVLMTASDSSGRVRASERGDLRTDVLKNDQQHSADSGVRLISRLELEPGSYLLGVAAIDGDKTTQGSVQYPLEVPDYSKGRIVVGDISIAVASDLNRFVGGSDRDWRKVFAESPTTSRVFGNEQDLLISCRVYLNSGPEKSINVTTTLRDADGEISTESPQNVELDAVAKLPLSIPYEKLISLHDLQRGTYSIEVQATPEGGPTASREVRFQLR